MSIFLSMVLNPIRFQEKTICECVMCNFILDDLMKAMQQVKRILHAKWSKSGIESNLSQEDMTAEAERILKKSQSKTASENSYTINLTFILFQKIEYLAKQRNT